MIRTVWIFTLCALSCAVRQSADIDRATSNVEQPICIVDDPICGPPGTTSKSMVRNYTRDELGTTATALSCGITEPGVVQCDDRVDFGEHHGWASCWVIYDPDTLDIEDGGCGWFPD